MPKAKDIFHPSYSIKLYYYNFILLSRILQSYVSVNRLENWKFIKNVIDNKLK